MRSLLAILFSLLIVMPIHSQNVDADTFFDNVSGMTADEAVRFAFENNGDLVSMRSEARAAESLVEQAGIRKSSSISADGQQQTIGLSHRYTVTGTMPLELGGRRASRVLTATKKFEVKQWAVRKMESELAFEVRKLFGVSLSKISKLRLLDEYVLSLGETLRLVRARVEEGRNAPLEERMMVVELNRFRSQRERAAGEVVVAIKELEKKIGRDEQTPLRLRGELAGSIEDFPSAEVLKTSALRDRNDLGFLRSLEDLANAKILATESDSKLDAAATVGYQRLRITESVQFNYVVFGIRFFLPTSNRDRALIRSAVDDKQAAGERLRFGELVVQRDVEGALARYSSAVRARSITENGVVEEAVKNLDVIRQMYELGSSSLVDYLAEQREVIKLRIGQIDDDHEYYNSRIGVLKATDDRRLF